jgi:predicted HAD superfamily hydrolase
MCSWQSAEVKWLSCPGSAAWIGSVQLFSFDVFDTLITRPVTRPVDLFRLLAVEVLGRDAPDSELEQFTSERVRAERSARRNRGFRDDITLSAIYEQFRKSIAYGRHAELAMEKEVEIELNSAVGIKAGIDAVQQTLASGRRVVLASDMYLPRNVIVQMLRGTGIDIDPRSVYVSGEIGLSKHTGRLFDFVAETEAVRARYCCHTGDNWGPDVLRPRQRGWRAALFTESTLTRYESPAARDPYWLATRAGGVSRASRLRQVSGSAVEASLASDVIGPFLTSFVSYVLLDARARGLDTLYFVSRDGQVLLRIAKALQTTGLAPEVDCRYLLGSRQAWFLPSVTEGRRQQFEWAISKGLSTRPRDILRRLEIDPSEVTGVLLELGISDGDFDSMQSESQLERFVDMLLTPAVSSRFLSRAKLRRATLIEYLSEQGLLDHGRRYALVDVGWSLQSQAALRRCLIAERQPADIFGYYLGVGERHVALEHVGAACAFVSQTGASVPSRVKANWFFRLSTILLIEHLFTLADHPGVVGYRKSEGGVAPVFRNPYCGQELEAFTNSLHREVVAYANFAGKELGSELACTAFIEWSLENVRRFACEPLPSEVAPIAWLPTNRELRHEARHTARLASPLSMQDIRKMVAHDLFPSREDHFSPDYAWHAGAAAISPPYIRGAYRALAGMRRLVAHARRGRPGLP